MTMQLGVSHAAAGPPRRPHLLLGLPLAALVLATGAAAWLGARRPQTATAADPARDDPRLTFATPYRNVRPEVRYVGDAACTACHADKVHSYHHHPMGQSLAPAGTLPPPRSKDGRTSFVAEGWEYLVERRGGRVFHEQRFRDRGGRVLASTRRPIAYALGSGRRGRSYLVDEDGFLFQSPVSWYSQKRLWDLSPGYAEANQHFERRISTDCLFCHSNRVRPVAGTLNRFQSPRFEGYGIGCERCHGPGELHVRRRQSGRPVEGLDDTIVNPADLRPELRDAVCEQCHLVGEQRVVRLGRREFDFRPGLPLHLFVSVFVQPPERAGEKAVGHVEQMHASRCFQKSGGKLSCFSCHDPHRLPAEERKAAYYRRRCLTCHASAEAPGCKLGIGPRRRENGDNCAACHMPRYQTTEVAHTAGTDHRIPRRRAAGRPGTAAPADKTLLVNFYRDRWDEDDPAAARDEGVALGMVAIRSRLPALGARALPLLDAGLELWPDDLAAWGAKGYALFVQQRYGDAREAFGEILARNPRDENALAESATLAGNLGRAGDALALWERAIAVSPYVSQYHHALAAVRAQRGEWDLAARACRQALRLNAARTNTRALLVASYLRSGHEKEARAEFEKLLILDPEHRSRMEEWFRQELRQARGR
jgi:cytochrome c-type biogenesis protein CcmH/NrfG